MAIYMRIPALKKTVLPEILLCYSFMENYCFLIREKITKNLWSISWPVQIWGKLAISPKVLFHKESHFTGHIHLFDLIVYYIFYIIAQGIFGGVQFLVYAYEKTFSWLHLHFLEDNEGIRKFAAYRNPIRVIHNCIQYVNIIILWLCIITRKLRV